MPRFIPPGLGWQRDIPDPRDFLPSAPPVVALLSKLKRRRAGRALLPDHVDWRDDFPPVGDQRQLLSCSAHACLGLVEYFERRARGKNLNGSRLFLYKMARRLQDVKGDHGACLRATFKAMIRFGVPPEKYWPDGSVEFDEEPAPFLFSFARDYRRLLYVRLDTAAGTGPDTLQTMKSFLAAGFPWVLGFSLFSSLSTEPDIPAPTVFDSVCGSQTSVAVGFQDRHRIRSTRGAFLIRNSWGPQWGDGGYGWLPYAYIEDHLAADVWAVLKADWLDSGEFDHPLG